MTQQNNEFEKWATKHIVSKRLLEFNTMKYENGMYKSHIMQRKFEAWQAATAESNKRIAELNSENKQIDAINYNLQVHINVLREALEDIVKTNASTHGTTQMMLAHCIKSANEALASTPPQSQTVKDALEKAAKIVQAKIGHYYPTPLTDAVAEIRALIEKELNHDTTK